ncbi:hypothetical protein VP01_9440g1 [Puccinia sorghi]|uniref:Uncharacterized protein n=1 Tax=Puccinia sorghi TaxID=27349 RepID=A0A0L6U6L2_9BASI|nr:hypothetical protein VP01_9440g1 [Puccinia sorghi]
MNPLCFQVIARRSSTQPRTWAVEPPNGSNHIWTSAKTNLPPVLSTIGTDLNDNCSPCLGTQMKFEIIEWNNSAFAFHFRKGLPSRITDQLALTGQRLKTLQQLINQTIELDNCYHNKIREDASKYKKKLPSKPFTPSALTLAPRLRKPTEIALVLNKEGQLNSEEQARREREGLCLYCGGKHELDSCVKRITREASKLAKNRR